MKQKIKLNERQLRAIVAESVKNVLNESRGKDKLKNSFKSKEDMTQYRDLYSPYDINDVIDTDNTLYDRESNGYGELGNGPYKNYRTHTFADGYDYCGDDNYNDYASEYNNALRKRLATKGGQMSYDWDSIMKQNRDRIKSQYDNLNSDADDRFAADIERERKSNNGVYRKRYLKYGDDEDWLTPSDKSDNFWGNKIRTNQNKHQINRKNAINNLKKNNKL